MSDVAKRLESHIDTLRPKFEQIQVDAVAFAKESLFAKQSLLSNDYLLQAARNNIASLEDAILNIASIGISLNPALAHAYLIPRKGNVCLDVSYRGLIQLATDTGSIMWAQSELVYQGDEFTFVGVGEKPIHRFNPFSKERGPLVGCYVVAKTLEGDFLTTAMGIEEVFKIRDTSEAFKKGYGPWLQFPGEMIKKTVIKRASKLWPKTDKSGRLEKAIEVLNEDEGIDFKSSYQEEKAALEADFPIPEEDKEVGPRYMIQNGKFRGKRFEDIEPEELTAYFDLLEQRIGKPDHKKAWEVELKNNIAEYMEMVEVV